MRRLAILGLLAVAGCGGDGETGESGACAAAVVWKGETYLDEGVKAGPRLRPAEELEGGVTPACHDTSPRDPGERDHPTRLRAIEGVPPEVAILHRRRLQMNVNYVIEAPEHPLHDLYFDELDVGPRGRIRGASCTVDGEVQEVVFGFAINTDRGRRTVLIREDAAIEGFDRDGLPYIERGAAVRVHGRCREDRVVARRIEPQR